MVVTDEARTDDVPDSSVSPPADRSTWVVGLDGSDCAAHALEWAASNVDGRASAIELVTAWQTPVVGAYPMASPMAIGVDDDETP